MSDWPVPAPEPLDYEATVERLQALVGQFVHVRITDNPKTEESPDSDILTIPVAGISGVLLVGNQNPLIARSDDEINGMTFWVGDPAQAADVTGRVAKGQAPTLSSFDVPESCFDEGLSDAHGVAFRMRNVVVDVQLMGWVGTIEQARAELLKTDRDAEQDNALGS
jgi:hypothetical protein